MKSYNLTKLLLTGLICAAATTASFGEIATDAKLQYNKGIDFYKLGQFEESANCFKRAIDLDPNYIDAYYNLGSILEYLNQKEAALSVFKQIILRKPEDYEAVYKTAVLSKNLGEYEKAKMYLSLIPPNSKVGIQAQKLAAEMETTLTELQKTKAQEQEAQAEELTDGMYEDISSPTGLVTDKNGNLYIAGFSIPIPQGVFLQASKASETAMINKVMEYMGNTTGKIADLFCGLGTFTYPLVQNKENEIISSDSSSASLQGLQKALNRNQIQNVKIIERNLFKDPMDASDLKGVKALVIDPPRAGAHEQCRVLATLSSAERPEKIVFVSCNPKTFVYDATTLIESGYEFKKVQ